MIAVNHVTLGQIRCRGFGPPLPRGHGAAFRLIETSTCPGPVPHHLRAPATIMVWINLTKARVMGYHFTPDQPDHSLTTGRNGWIGSIVIALALPAEQV